MQKFKTIREAMTMSPYAIGMAQAKKMYGYGKGPATDLPKKVIKKAHDIAKRVKANESFEDLVDESVDLTDKDEKGVTYKGMGTDVVNKKKKLNPTIPLTQKDRQVKDYMEEVEDLDELSKKTLAAYAMSASSDAVKNQRKQSNYQRVGDDDDEAPGTQKLYTRMANKAGEKKVKRLSGIATALSKLAKEEVENIDELSKKTLGSYVKGAKFDAIQQTYAKKNAEAEKKDLNREYPNIKRTHPDYEKVSDKYYKADSDYEKADNRMIKRSRGINKAVDKLTKEEVEDLDELSKKMLGSYAQAATMDAAKKGNEVAKIGNNLAALAHPMSPLNKLNKRLAGHAQAINKLTKEEVLDELSKKTLGSYVNKAVTSVHNLGYNAGSKMSSGDVNTGMKSAINSIKRQTNINTAVKKLAKEAKEEMPTGIKIYHKNKDTGQEGSAIQFTVKNAQAHIKDLKKAGHSVTGKSLMFGKKEGPRKPMGEEKLDELKKSTYGDYINRASRSLRASASIRKDFERDAERDAGRAYKSGVEPAEKERHLKNYEVNKGLAADFAKDSEKRLKGISRATKKLTK